MQDPVPSRREHTNNTWIIGLVLILVGVVLLVTTYTDVRLDNWWALFILIPAIGAFASAYNFYRRAGRITPQVANTFVGGLAPLAVALIFLFNLSWGKLWPIFIVIAGLGMLARGAVVTD